MPVNTELQTILQLRIELQHSNPLIWRTVLVPSNITLIKLHLVIQQAMGWWGGHLHEFEIDHIRYGMTDPEWDLDLELVDEKRKRLTRLLGRKKGFTYLYDFGDYWLHKVKVEKTFTVTTPQKHALCIGGENACPPEDVGGLPGYEEFLDVIADPKHEERDEMLEWAGGSFDPAVFDQEDANEFLSQIKM